MENFIIGFVQSHPVLMAIVAAVGTLRLTLKPLLEVVRIVVKATPTKKDEEMLEKFEKSKTWRNVLWFIEYVSSIDPKQVKDIKEAVKSNG